MPKDIKPTLYRTWMNSGIRSQSVLMIMSIFNTIMLPPIGPDLQLLTYKSLVFTTIFFLGPLPPLTLTLLSVFAG